MPETVDDLLEQWRERRGPITEAEAQRLVDEVERLRAQNLGFGVRIQEAWKRIDDLRGLLDHAVQSWSPRGTGRAPMLAEWDDTDWADSGWSGGERDELRSALARISPERPLSAPETPSVGPAAPTQPEDGSGPRECLWRGPLFAERRDYRCPVLAARWVERTHVDTRGDWIDEVPLCSGHADEAVRYGWRRGRPV